MEREAVESEAMEERADSAQRNSEQPNGEQRKSAISGLSPGAVKKSMAAVARGDAAQRPQHNTLENGHGQTSSECLQRQLAELQQELQQLRVRSQHTDQQLQGILSSKSWKLTQPLRSLMELRRALGPIFRSRTVSFSLQPGRNVEVLGKRCTVIGPSPFVILQPVNGAVPSGWCLLRSRIGGEMGHMLFALHYRQGEHFDDAQRVVLPLADTTFTEHLLHLPTINKGMRLDPFLSEGEFTLEQLEVEEVGLYKVARALFKKYAGPHVRQPAVLWHKLRKAWALYREGGVHALKIKLFANQLSNNYQEWVDKYDSLTDNDRALIGAAIERFSFKPLISVIMPTYNTPERYLRAAIESVRRQLYPNWELCICDDASPNPEVRKVLAEYQALDSRIRVIARTSNGHIAQASNDAAGIARGEYLALLDHDDELSEHALYLVANELQGHRNAGLLYSDEDKLTSFGMRFNPYFKSGWNPELLLSQNFICHLSVVRRELFERVGGFRSGVDGAQDWDLILRISRELRAQEIRHIPFVLYHWRVIEGSTAQSTSYKPYVVKSQQRAVRDHLDALGFAQAQVEYQEHLAHVRVRFPIPSPAPLVSIIIPTKDKLSFLQRTLESILKKTHYKNFEILVVDNGSVEEETLTYLQELVELHAKDNLTLRDGSRLHERVRVLRDDLPFNFSRLNNTAVEKARGEVLAFLNNDLEVITPEWLDEMLSQAVRPNVGAVGARLLYPNGLLQHAGVILGIGGVAGHNHKGQRRENPGYFNRAVLSQNLSAVTAACLLMRREVFTQVAGFDQEHLSVAFNDIDLCLRVRQAGYEIIYTPFAELYHFESASRGYEVTDPRKFARFEAEVGTMKQRWRHVLLSDPYYNPNLSLITEDFAFAFPPRVERPWRTRAL
jgi:glycosyltransferase involved in cell wall biosynthesis